MQERLSYALPQTLSQALTHLSHCCEHALLAEVSATPKPGLVDRRDNGAHTDMCFDTFVASTAAIVPHLTEMARVGFEWEDTEVCHRSAQSGSTECATDKANADHSHCSLFRAIRPIGMEAERAMFAATGGINTHKGMIFSMGLIAAASGLYYRRHGNFQPEAILELSGTLCLDELKRDFVSMDPEHPKTHGEKLYARYGSRGIRGEAMNGFPAIRDVALPVIRRGMNHGAAAANQAYLNTLLALMAQVDDTNVLIRTSPELLAFEKAEAARIIALGGADTDAGMDALRLLNEEFIRLNISPGGCADLLAVTILLWNLEQYGK